MSTIFEKIIAREVPANIIYEDDSVIAILDIGPVQPGHTLVIPKAVSADARDCDDETLAKIMAVAKRIANAQTTILGCDGVNMIFNCGAAAGQEVFHTHLHVIPRAADDGAFAEPLRGAYEDGESSELAAALQATL